MRIAGRVGGALDRRSCIRIEILLRVRVKVGPIVGDVGCYTLTQGLLQCHGILLGRPFLHTAATQRTWRVLQVAAKHRTVSLVGWRGSTHCGDRKLTFICWLVPPPVMPTGGTLTALDFSSDQLSGLFHR